MSRLFDPDKPASGHYSVYLAVPMTGGSVADASFNQQLRDELQRAIDAATRHATAPWTVEIISGADHSTPDSPNRDVNAAREWVRRTFATRVDGLIVVLPRESVGCGR